VTETTAEQNINREGSVSHPGVPVVPIARP
jgi:hypothetical protein